MNWLSTFSIALCSGILGLVCAALIAAFCAQWYGVSNFEGKAGYFMIFLAMIGGVAGFVVGAIAARIVAAGAAPGFFKGLGVGLGAVLLIALVALALCRWFADIAPTIDGQSLALEIEVRCPKKFTLPKTPDEYGATAEVYLPGGRRQQFVNLQLDDVKTVDGFLIVTATVPLNTSASKKYLNVRFSKEHNLTFALPSRPQREWSQWFDSGWDFGKPAPAKEEKIGRASCRERV